ncbi:RbsD/FucU domain-containing protein [Carboxylicivirga sp. RSCT41]|uniref:RbsD/FucU domain-containing protein n=1 Tax=Carboxylicivirga agarovorans TaxID=3417570 RepID=UPI003D331D71
MKNIVFGFIVFVLSLSCSSNKQHKACIENKNEVKNWKTEVTESLKVFGHRNWIVIADAAYPRQSNPAIQTITIDANHIEAVEFVNDLIDKASHVDANILVDKEMAFVSEEHAKGIEAYREALHQILEGENVKSLLHEDIIRELDTSAKLFNILIIKTDLSVPYTSVFFQLECGYWNGEAEKELRNKMKSNE